MEPRFRYLQDVQVFLDDLDEQIKDTLQRVRNQQQVMARRISTRAHSQAVSASLDLLDAAVHLQRAPSTLTASSLAFRDLGTHKAIASLEQFVISDGNTGPGRSVRQKIDLRMDKVVIPQVKKLKDQYALVEDLYKQMRVLESVETQVTMQFRDSRDLPKILRGIQDKKKELARGLREVFQFLKDVANAHVPKAFKEYVAAVAAELAEHVVFRASRTLLYVTVSDKGSLIFTSYIVLEDALNEDGELAPQLYISIQWNQGLMKQGKEVEAPYIKLWLDHDLELPNGLARRSWGQSVSSVNTAVRAIGTMLDLENFSSSIGVVPLSLRLKIDPGAISKKDFSFRDYIQRVAVDTDKNLLRFTLSRVKGVDKNSIQEIAKALYPEVQAMMRGSRTTRMRMKIEREADNWHIDFIVTEIARGTAISLNDLEFLRTRFGLNDRQLRKVSQIFEPEE